MSRPYLFLLVSRTSLNTSITFLKKENARVYPLARFLSTQVRTWSSGGVVVQKPEISNCSVD